ncbi:MAG: hypothetical protein K8R60_23295 [Burkholderiales bacterium]|nr:hypothetical protein [Burkholderiales bacterium]
MSLAVAEPLSLLPIEKTSATSRPLPDGPGWFDSSWELRSGLQVKEGWPADSTLHGWIETWLQLVGGGGGGAGLSLSAT